MEISGITIPPAAILLGLTILASISLMIAEHLGNKTRRMNTSVRKATNWHRPLGILMFMLLFLLVGALDYYVEQPGNVVVKFLYQGEAVADYPAAQDLAHALVLFIALVWISIYAVGVGTQALFNPREQSTMILMLSIAFIAIVIGYGFFGAPLTTFLNEQVWPPEDAISFSFLWVRIG